MKATIIVLVVMTIAAIIAVITGVELVSFHGNGVVQITQHNYAGRFAAAVVGTICGVAAYGCAKRKMYGWWIVTAMLVALVGYGVVWTVWKMTTTELDFFGNLLGATGQAVKIAALIWFLVVWWMPKRKEFFGAKSEIDQKGAN